MVVLDIFTKNIAITYKTTFFSKATFLLLLFGFVSVVLPFIFAYKSRGFWMKRDVFYEQPDIRFKGKYIFKATTNNSNVSTIICSTYPYLEQKLEMVDYCTTIKFREIDLDFDGRRDEFHLALKIRLPNETYLTSVAIMIAVDYKLNGFCPLQMQSAIIYQDFIPVTVSNILIIGDVILVQSGPVLCNSHRVNNFYNYSIVSDEENIDNYRFSNIFSDYAKRNVSTKLTNLYTSFISDSTQQFDMNIKLRFPENRIVYKPGFWQIIKWAWIQYFAIYTVISCIISTIKNYIFNKRLVLFYEDNPIRKKQ